MNKIELGFSFKDVDSVKAAQSINVPTLIMNSDADTVTPYFMGKDIYDALASADKQLWTVKDSKHTALWKDYNAEYSSRLLKLIN